MTDYISELSEKQKQFHQREFTANADNWESPCPVPRIQTPKFNPGLLPVNIAPWVHDVSHRMSVPPESLIPSIYTLLSTVIGNSKYILPKEHDESWVVVARSWGLLVASPSTQKTPGTNQILHPLHEIDKELLKKYEDEMQNWAPREKILNIELKSLESQLKDSFSPNPLNLETSSIQNRIEQLMERINNERPKAERFIVNDATIEALQEIMKNSSRILAYYDEMSRLLETFAKSERAGDRGFYTELYSIPRNRSYKVDRLGRGATVLQNPSLSILGNIQPSVLAKHFDRSDAKVGEDGFFNRFQIAVMPNYDVPYKLVDQNIDQPARDRFNELISRLIQTKGPDHDQCFKFDHSAQKAFNEWLEAFVNKLRLLDEKEQAHFGKYRSLLPALALIDHVCSDIVPHSNLVSSESLFKAIGLLEFLEGHAKNILGLGGKLRATKAALLSQKIINGEVPNEVTLRTLKRNNWAGLNTDEDLNDALKELQDLHWLKIISKANRSTVILINPALSLKEVVSAVSAN